MDLDMDIAVMSINMHQASTSQAVGIAVTKKAMDSNEENCLSLIKEMELSINPSLGSNIDVRV